MNCPRMMFDGESALERILWRTRSGTPTLDMGADI